MRSPLENESSVSLRAFHWYSAVAVPIAVPPVGVVAGVEGFSGELFPTKLSGPGGAS